MNVWDEAETEEVQVAPTLGREPPQPFSSLVKVDFAGQTHTGKVRSRNEDHFLICQSGRFLETLQSNLPSSPPGTRSEEIGYGLVVADGVGGNAAGARASQLAIDTMVNLVLHTPDWIMRLDDDLLSHEVMRRAGDRFREVNRVLTERANEDPKLRGYATTMTVAVSLGKDLVIAHIGDSRAYLLRGGRLHRLTRDHTLAQALADEGLILPEEVASHPRGNVLTRALGDQQGRFPPDIEQFYLEDGDCLLLCSDGLTDMVDEPTLARVLSRKVPASELCKDLIDRALEAGGKDNVTVVAARYRIPSRKEERASDR